MSNAGSQDEEGSVAGRIAQALTERIVAGVLPPGAPVRQDHLAMEFSASHVPVREAFRKLEAQGLLVSAPRRGVRVAPLSPESVLEVAEMRAALEVLALRHAAPRLTEADLRSASEALGQSEASADIQAWETGNRRFHRAIVGPCEMPRLLRAIEELQSVGARHLFAAWRDLDWRPRSDQEHRLLLAKLTSSAIDSACETLRRHILDAGVALRDRLAG